MRAILVVAVLCAAACGSTSSTAPAPTAPTPAAKPALPDVPFDQLDHDQRAQFMDEKVVPVMAEIFKAHDPQKYATFGCKTCHGPGAEKGEFHMPNPELPKLNFSDMSKFKPEALEWMNSKVKPAMAALLKQPEMTKENPDGFGCLACHEMEGQH
ncbi:MAG: hypothetical protein AB7P03_19675 [Kofleriaceae bacterium]